MLISTLTRTVSEAPDDDVLAVAEGNRRFAADMYEALAAAGDGNLVFSPSSIRLALPMAV